MEILLDRARLLLDQGRTNDAIREVKQFLQEEPENDEALSLYARCLYNKNEISEGIKVTLQAIRLEPENSFYFYLLAFGYYKQDKNNSALLKPCIVNTPLVVKVNKVIQVNKGQGDGDTK